MAAGTVTITEVNYRPTQKVIFAWTSGTVAEAGTASGTTTDAYWGDVIGLTTTPDGVDVPTANYDITVTDANSHDVLLGAGANRSDTNTEHVASASLACAAGSKLTINVTNAGSAKKGTAILYISQR